MPYIGTVSESFSKQLENFNIFFILFSGFRVIQPICLGGFVSYFAQTNATEISTIDAYWYASGIVLATGFITLTFHPFVLYTAKEACKIRVACSGLIYSKSLRLLKSATQEGQNGQIINLLSNDLSKFDRAITFLYCVWKGPFETIAYSMVIYREIGISAVIGMAFLVAFVPLQGNFDKHQCVCFFLHTLFCDIKLAQAPTM